MTDPMSLTGVVITSSPGSGLMLPKATCSAAVPELPLHLNIGINSGEPIHEGDDLFGTPVQLAARVCAYAGTDQIAVSKLVKDLCAGKGLKFNDLGEVEFKGFAEKIHVSEVLWRQMNEDKAAAKTQ